MQTSAKKYQYMYKASGLVTAVLMGRFCHLMSILTRQIDPENDRKL